ncbi:unnamed protein product [Echinostoma caproni]|uniref:Dynein_C domain-containing protein n=1 Tax=Echinostoma caproni TaxID=27848 RepID=A0A183BDE4_9TREM|nr:unnamed protein product [Echinostoma caproni]
MLSINHCPPRSRPSEGIPISSQWNPKGYPYAIQIAQFGLSHYTKLLDLKQHLLTPAVVAAANHMDSSVLDLDLTKAVTQESLVRVEEQSHTWKQEADGSIRFFGMFLQFLLAYHRSR